MTTQPTRRRAAFAAAMAACWCLALSGCIPQGLAFRVDDRLSITAPKDRAEVTLPVTVTWEMRDFTISKGEPTGPTSKAGYFAVFVDRAPQPAGKPLAWLARKDRGCRPADGCPDEEYFAARGIYSTTATHLTFEQLPRPSNTHQKERHTVTVVLLDPSGRRIGETAAQVVFVVRRKALS